jgi:hypothetical protein
MMVGVGVAVVALLLTIFLVVIADPNSRVIEELRSPIAVAYWSEKGLHLTDGRTVNLPGVQGLPRQSEALAEATRRGVEVGSDGRIHALVRVHHWCGNDRVREHIARVDLARLLLFVGDGPARFTPEFGISVKPGGTFSPAGWDVGEFQEFRLWCEYLDGKTGPIPLRPS